jgi:hypothetical protein
MRVLPLKTESNQRGLAILLALVLTSLAIFCAEKKFLVPQKRGSTLNKYEKMPWLNQVLMLAEDFEELATDSASLQKEHFFSYGGASISAEKESADADLPVGGSALKVTWNASQPYGGWGKGIGANINLNTETDYLNFYVKFPPAAAYPKETLKVVLEEDDNDNGKLDKDLDDAWTYTATIAATGRWQLICIPLKDFTDDNEGGDHVLNITRKGGIHTMIFSLMQPDKYTKGQTWYFDFIFFSAGKIDASAPDKLD